MRNTNQKSGVTSALQGLGVFLLASVFCLLAPSLSSAQGSGPGKYRSSLEIPSQDAPTCLKPSSGLVVDCYDGYVYFGHGAVAAGTAAGTALTTTDSMGTCPATGACNFIYADTSGVLHITTTLATAYTSTTVPLYFVETVAGNVTLMQPVWRNTFNTAPAISSTFGVATYTTLAGGAITVTAAKVTGAAAAAGYASFNAPAGTAPTTPAIGDIWNDSTKKAMVISPTVASNPLSLGGALAVVQNQTAITTVSTIQAMNSTTVTVPAGAMNVAGKTLHVKGYFVFSNGVTTPTITITLKLGSVLMAAPVSTAIVASNSSSPAWFDFYCTTASTGASGTVEAHGTLSMDVADNTHGNPLSTFPDFLAAASSAVDLTSSENVTVNMTVANGPVTTATLRLATFEILN